MIFAVGPVLFRRRLICSKYFVGIDRQVFGILPVKRPGIYLCGQSFFVVTLQGLENARRNTRCLRNFFQPDIAAKTFFPQICPDGISGGQPGAGSFRAGLLDVVLKKVSGTDGFAPPGMI